MWVASPNQAAKDSQPLFQSPSDLVGSPPPKLEKRRRGRWDRAPCPRSSVGGAGSHRPRRCQRGWQPGRPPPQPGTLALRGPGTPAPMAARPARAVWPPRHPPSLPPPRAPSFGLSLALPEPRLPETERLPFSPPPLGNWHHWVLEGSDFRSRHL